MSTSIKRKPVPSSKAPDPNSKRASNDETNPPDEVHQSQSCMLEPIERVEIIGEHAEPPPDFDKELENLQLETEGEELAPTFIDVPISEELETIDQKHEDPAKPSKFKTAMGEIKHFAGGIIARPYEATKHFSVLRHSHGLVYYRGPTTSVAITVFSDEPLPTDRKLWLQKKGT